MAPVKRFLLLWVTPVLALLVLALWPVIRGSETFFLRDAFNAHLPMKTAEAAALLEGRLPLVAPELAGGQPLLGNANAVPLYPDNLLYLVLPLLSAFNAHFWLHLLLAPFGLYWLARAWGLGRPAAWAAGVTYATGGYLVSLLNFYNLIAGAALAPALAAAVLVVVLTAPGTGAPRVWPGRPWGLVSVAVLWALLLLAGDPATAVVALAMAGAGALLHQGRRVLRASVLLPTAGAFACGTLLAAPQWIEMWRILGLSSRGYHGFTAAGQVVGSLHPAQLLEGLLPLAFGRPDQMREGAFWGYPFYGGHPPIFFTLYPGLLTLALAALAFLPGDSRGRRLRTAALAAVGTGLFLALGQHNPILELLRRLPGTDLLRYPVKLWLPAAVGLALLAGCGFERWFASAGAVEGRCEMGGDAPRPEPSRLFPSRRWLTGLLGGLTVAYVGLWSFLTFAPEPAAELLREWIPASFGAPFVAFERLRWAGLALLTTVTLLALLTALAVARRHPRAGGVLLLVIHTTSQLVLLRPARATDRVEPYLEPPPLLASIPVDSRLVHGSYDNLFGRFDLRLGGYQRPTAQALERRAFRELYPPAGILAGRRYELNLSPEGLGSFFTRVARDAVRHSDDVERLRLLAAWGVDRLLLHRPLEGPAAEQVELLREQTGIGETLRLYAVREATPEVFFAHRLRFAPSLGQAVEELRGPSFDARHEVVLAGNGPTAEGSGGDLELLELGPESLRVEVDAEGPGAVVWQRAWLAIYHASVDGEVAPVEVANVHRMAVRVGPGAHRVEIRTDRRPLALGFGLTLLGALGLWWLAFRWPPGTSGASPDLPKPANMSAP